MSRQQPTMPHRTSDAPPMSDDSPTDSPREPHWMLRRTDQAAIAVLLLIALGATIGWWFCQGGWQGRLVELDQSEALTASFQVDINQANWPELAQLPGIGPELAERIIESRQTDGPFLTHDDLLRIRGIGPKTLEKIRPYLRPLPAPGQKLTP